MKTILPVFSFALLLCAACSDKPDLLKPAVTGFPTPMFDGMIGAAKGDVIKTIPPQTVVYVQHATLKIADAEYVKVSCNDTTGYVPKGWLLEDGKLGVVDCSEASPIQIFNDVQLSDPSGKTLSELQLIGYKELSNGLSQIVYMYEEDGSRPWFGYFKAPVISDSASMAFFNLYYEAKRVKRYENDSELYDALKNDERFHDAPLRAVVFGSSSAGHAPMAWIDEDGNSLSGDDIPGEFVLHYVWDDFTESDGNHLGDVMEHGVPECDRDRSVMDYKMLFTPNRKMNIALICTIEVIAKREGPMITEFNDVEPGQTYEFLVTHRIYNAICAGEAKFAVQTSLGLRGEGMVYASCGD